LLKPITLMSLFEKSWRVRAVSLIAAKLAAF